MRTWLRSGFGVALALSIGLACVLLLVATQRSPVAAQTSNLQLEKRLLKTGDVVQVGETVTFAITITNTWNTTVITLPLIDDYDQSILGFVDAAPAQNTHIAATGVISWNNLLASSGPLAPGQSTVVYVRFVAEHPTADLRVVNRARTHDVYDQQQRKVGDGSGEEEGNAVGGRTPIIRTLAMITPPA